MPQGLCAYITGLYLIYCISYTVVQTNGTDLHTAGRICEKTFPFTENYVCSLVCVSVCVCLPTTKHRNNVIEVALMNLFALK